MIKAIETEYKGYKFRSRLEARWAVFFDTVGIEYEYEPEGYEAGDGIKYLPDFYFPEYDWYGEVKALREGAGEELQKALSFVREKKTVLALFGNIPYTNDIPVFHYYALYYNRLRDEVLAERFCIDIIDPADDRFALGQRADFVTWLGIDKKDALLCGAIYHAPGLSKLLSAKQDRELYVEYGAPASMAWCSRYDDFPEMVEGLKKGYTAARKARFEHGETPEAD